MLETIHTDMSSTGMGMLAYLIAHWRGDQNIAQSLLVNGALPYFVLEMVFLLVYLLTFTTPIYLVSLIAIFVWFVCFFAWLVWCVVGTGRSAIRTLRGASGITFKILAVVALALVVAVLVKTVQIVNDVLLLTRLTSIQ